MTQTTCTACGKSFHRATAFISWGRTYCSPSCFNKSVGKRPSVVGYQQQPPTPTLQPKPTPQPTPATTIVLPRKGGCGTCGKAR